jgi:hypothetical protein
MLGLTRTIVQAVMQLRPRFQVAAQKLAAGGRAGALEGSRPAQPP